MSVVSEHNEFISTKQNNEVEDYLIRIIKRYFEVHEDYTRNEMEAIVQESFTRLKRWMLRHRQFIFSLNQETGHLVLDISFFNGEPEITEKKTAFNKDFGEEEDTICEGNDPRLYDMRIPLEHTHNLSDIPGLREVIGLLNETRFPDIHGHNNLSVLNCITYTGSNMLIDLIMIEEVLDNIEDYRNRLQEKGNYALFEHNKYLREYDLKLGIVQEYFENIATEITQQALSWTEDAEIYINQTVKPDPILEPIGAFKQAYMLNKIQKVFGKMDKILYTGRVPIPVSTVKSEVTLVSPDSYTYVEDLLLAMRGELSDKQMEMLGGSAIEPITKDAGGFTVFDFKRTFAGEEIYSTYQRHGYAVQVLYNNELYYMHGNDENNIVKDANRDSGTLSDPLVHIDLEFNRINDATVDVHYKVKNISGHRLENIGIGSAGDIMVGNRRNDFDSDDAAPLNPILSKEDGNTYGITMTAVVTKDDNGRKPAMAVISFNEEPVLSFSLTYGQYNPFAAMSGDHYNSFAKPIGENSYNNPHTADASQYDLMSNGICEHVDSGMAYCTYIDLDEDEEVDIVATFCLFVAGMFAPTEGSTVIGNISDNRILASVQTGPGITKYTENLKSIHTNNDGDIDSTRILLSFEYEDEDDYTHVSPLPFRYTTEDNYEVYIRGRYNKATGKIEARASMLKHIPFLCSFPYPLYYDGVNNFNRDAYVPIFLTEDSDIVKTRKTLEKYGCDIPILNQILHRDLAQYMKKAYDDGDVIWVTTNYYIGGIHNGTEYVEGFEEDSPVITYYNEIDHDDTDKPLFGGNVTITFNDDGSSNIKALFIEEDLEPHGFILHYKDKLLTDYFKNPRIRYDIMGNDIS